MKLLPRLTELQAQHGYLSAELLPQLAREEQVPLYGLQGLVSYYPHFRVTPPPIKEIAVCRDLSCWLADGPRHCTRLRQELDGQSHIAVHEVSCLGRCDNAPAAL